MAGKKETRWKRTYNDNVYDRMEVYAPIGTKETLDELIRKGKELVPDLDLRELDYHNPDYRFSSRASYILHAVLTQVEKDFGVDLLEEADKIKPEVLAKREEKRQKKNSN